MCLICSDLSKGLITPKEARANAREAADTLSIRHALEVLEKIEEVEENDETSKP